LAPLFTDSSKPGTELGTTRVLHSRNIMHHLRHGSETSTLVRRYKSGSLPLLSPAGTLRLYEVVQQALWPAVLFVFVLLMQVQPLRFNNGFLTQIITVLGVLIMLALPFAALVIYALGMFKTVQVSVARSSAVLFWFYWPFCRFVVCIAALSFAYSIGDQLWFNNFRLYEQYYRLQAYDNVDTYTVTGTRLMDAGVVRFNTSAGVDRSKASCIVNTRTYCIAPIVQGGIVKPGVPQSKTGVQDFFMAGVDCCNCPVTDFRCGQWDDTTSGKLGGMRLFDDESNKMYRLAAEKWAANYNKDFVHGVYFNWNNEPIEAWKNLWARGLQLTIISCLVGVIGSFLIMLLLNGLMRLLRNFAIAAPLDENPPMMCMPGTNKELPRQGFMPDEYRNYLTQRDPPGGDGEDAKVLVL